jgi:hypothetical protein
MIPLHFGQWWSSTEISTSSFPVFNTFTGSLTCEFTLYFSETREQTHDQRSHLPKCFGVDQAVQRSHMDPLLLKVVQAVYHLYLSSA